MANSYLRHPDNYLTGTRRLSLEERGAYADIIDLYISRDGDLPDDDRGMAYDLACDMRIWRRVKASLIEVGKIEIEGGFIVPRGARTTLAKCLAKSVSAKEAADTRWSRKRRKQLNNNETHHANASADAMPIKSSQVSIEPNGSINTSIDDDFSEWYSAYPNKVGKGQAAKAYRTARKLTDQQTLLDGVAAYRRDKPPDRAWCNPATWLNGQRWLDQPAPETERFNGKSTHTSGQGQRGSIAASVSRYVAARDGQR